MKINCDFVLHEKCENILVWYEAIFFFTFLSRKFVGFRFVVHLKSAVFVPLAFVVVVNVGIMCIRTHNTTGVQTFCCYFALLYTCTQALKKLTLILIKAIYVPSSQSHFVLKFLDCWQDDAVERMLSNFIYSLPYKSLSVYSDIYKKIQRTIRHK